MRLDGGLAEHQPLHDLGVGEADADQAQDLRLAQGQLGQVGVRRGAAETAWPVLRV
ncbi:hypothetical protein [Micromonospora avicenniae]|uniref:hypothetical protein n=1 Tax=Micromonospora avicenniae TaxID=1198245 RepID=UPI003326F840